MVDELSSLTSSSQMCFNALEQLCLSCSPIEGFHCCAYVQYNDNQFLFC